MDELLKQIREERGKQDNKWGIQNHDPFYWLSILMEEVGEASKASLQRKRWQYRKELIQVAAVAVAAIEALDRGYW